MHQQDWQVMDPDGLLSNNTTPAPPPHVLILTPVKDAASFLPGYFERLLRLTYSHELISVGLLESDSVDESFEIAGQHIANIGSRFRRARIWQYDFSFSIPRGVPRWHPAVQPERRSVLARSRNHLLMHALDDEVWVLWLDVDVIEFPADLIERLLATGKDIVQPHCVERYGGPTFDLNGWRDKGTLHLDDLRHEGTFAELHAVGGTALWIRADIHRDGLIFPPFPYGRENSFIRNGPGEVETEGLGMMAKDMGHTLWGMPHLEILHRP